MVRTFGRTWAVAWGAIGLGVGVAAADDVRVSCGVIDVRGTTMRATATYGPAINGLSFQGQALTSFASYQYAIYYVTEPAAPLAAHVAVARRKLPDGPWQVADLRDSVFKNGVRKGTTEPDDAHNTCSIGIAEGDGTIHVAYDHHNHVLRYRNTAPGAASHPDDTKWEPGLFAAEHSDLVPGQIVKTVCYPFFLRTPQGGLQLAMRRGESGNGSWWLYDYDAAAHAWTGGWQYDDGTVGTYTAITPVGTRRCAYPNGWTYGPDGRLHLTWTWREESRPPSGGRGNHDVCYAYSDDNGRTWKNNVGTVISAKDAGNGVPKTYTIDTPGLVVVPVEQTQAMINTQGQAVDGKGRVHTLMSRVDPAKGTHDPKGSTFDTKGCSYVHSWRSDDGTWKETVIPADVGGRPKLVFDRADNAYAVFTNGGGTALYARDRQFVIARATAAAGWADWAIVHTDPGPFVSEPLIDEVRMKTDGVLSVFMQGSPKADNQPTAIRVFDVPTSK